MGFSSALQGRAAHDALLVRQDAELRLLDTMKRCLLQKVKCDKEYAIQLAAVSQHGLKIDRADDLQGSLITKAWRCTMEEWDHTAKQLKINAELLESVCKDKLTHLYQDKQKARKAYQEEHSKIAAQFNNLNEDVLRKKVEYQKNLDYYKSLRSRFEEHYVKSGRGGRKLDDVRDKYQKACRKLHLAHNEYVLLISDASEVEKDFRTILLPGLLEHQQSLQEGFITVWRNILQEASRHSDFSGEKFQEIQRRIESNLQNVNPAEEYREFTEKHKTSPAAPIVFQFDQALIEDTLGNKLQPNALTVDNLTVDWLRSRLGDLETSIKECQDKQTKVITDGNGIAKPASPILNGVNGTGKDVHKHSKDLNTLRCLERQMQKSAEMIKTALNEVGCEELPSGCDDLSVDQNFIESNGSPDQPDAQNGSYLLQKGAEVIEMIKAPFKRKSAPSIVVCANGGTEAALGGAAASSMSPKGTPTSLRGGSVTRSLSLGSSVNSLDELRNSCDSTNIYAEIDVNRVLMLLCEQKNNQSLNMLDGGSLADDTDATRRRNDENGSKNNLLEFDGGSVSATGATNVDINDEDMWKSVNVHLDNIDRVNKSLDEKLFNNTIRTTTSTVTSSESGDTEHRSSLREMLKSTFSREENVETERLLEDDCDKDDEKPAPKPSSALNMDFFNVSLDSIDDDGKELSGADGTATKQSISDPKKKEKKKPKNISVAGDAREAKKSRSKSFKSNKSVNALLTSFKDFKNSKRKIDEEVFEHVEPVASQSEKMAMTAKEPSLATVGEETTATRKNIRTANHHVSCEEDVNLLPTHSKTPVRGKQEIALGGAAKKPKKPSKLKKLKLKLKLPSSSGSAAAQLAIAVAKRPICRHCFKRLRRESSLSTTGNATVIETSDESPMSPVLQQPVADDFCVCHHESDDGLCINEHTYSDLDGMTLATNRPLYEEEWFHGVLPREEVVRLLKNDGDFLVRETIRNEESQIVLSVSWNGHKHFIVQTTAEGHFRFEGPAFPSIQELIMHQHMAEAPVTGRSGAVLKKPVLRERWELSNDDVILHDKIGRGNFGDVYKARLKSSKKQVAVKTCRMTLPDEQKRKFLQEGRILKQYDHPNIVKLIGICVQKQPIMIVMELVPGGSLLNFLRKNTTTMNSKQLMGMCRDAAAGMRYLESKNCIHRDLAARNCLIGYENIVKISDFGMSREEEEYIVSDGMKQIPIKWTAPEALNFGKYTSLCDVWSYGILMWEIFSKGDTPYTGMSNSRARERIDSGYRMPAPDSTPAEMYRLMLKCWAYEPEARPHFDEIHTVVDALISRE